MKTDEALNPVDIDLFGSGTVAVEAHCCPDPIGAAGKYVEVTSFYEKEILHSLRIL